MNFVLDFLLEVSFAIWLILGAVLPYLYLGQMFSSTFLKKRYWVIILFLQILAGRTIYELRHFLIPIFFYLVFTRVDKREKEQSLFLSLFLFLLYQSIRYLLVTFFIRMILDYGALPEVERGAFHSLFDLLALLCSVLLLRFLPIDWELFFQKDFKPTLRKSLYVLLPLTLFRIFSSFMSNEDQLFYSRFDTTVSLTIFMVFLVWYLQLRKSLQNYKDIQTIKRQEEENRAMQETVNRLGSLYEEIRGFRHDFAGIIASMEPAIANKDIDEIEDIYRKVFLKTNEKLRKSDYTAFNLQNIEDIPLRNVLAKALIRAQNQGIRFSLETIGYVRKLDLPMLEAVRLLSILTSNALEAAIEAEKPHISVALIAGTDEVKMVIENTRKNEKLDPTKLNKNGYSTKGTSRGTGLYTLEKIVSKYDLELETSFDETSFTQVLTLPMRPKTRRKP